MGHHTGWEPSTGAQAAAGAWLAGAATGGLGTRKLHSWTQHCLAMFQAVQKEGMGSGSACHSPSCRHAVR